MNAAQQRELFWNLFAQLDSDQPGEREAALAKIHSLRGKMGWSRFVDLRGVSPEKLAEAEKSIEQWMQAHAARVTENTALTRRNTALAARIAVLRSALFVMINWRMVASVSVVVALCSGGWWWWSNAEAAPSPVATATAEDSARAAVDAALRDVLSRTSWGEGDTAPVVITIGGVPFWVTVRGSVDAQSHADARGNPVQRHCLRLYADEAVRDAGAFVAPAPYVAFGLWMKWPQRATECRMPGTRNYQ